MPQSFACLHYHIIFSTKSRTAGITPDLEPRLYEYIGGILRADGGCLIAAGGMLDHVHLLYGVDEQTSVADAVRTIKANSSKWMHETFPAQRAFAWQTGYAAFAVSYSNIEDVKRYLAGQREHHERHSFQDELVAFLKSHDIAFDERHLLD